MPGTGPVSRGIAHHPYTVKSLDELPQVLAPLVEAFAHLVDQIDFIMVVPQQSFFKGLFGRRQVPAQALLFYPDGVLHLLASDAPGDSGKTTHIEARNLVFLRSSLLLLYGKLEIAAQRGADTQAIEVEYNTVFHEMLKPRISRLIQSAWSGTAPSKGDTHLEMPVTTNLPYKFQSGLRIYGLQPNEELCGYVFQPEILEPRLGFFRRKITPNTLLALTDRQVILIQEEIASTSHYGWVITYIPRHRVTAIRSDAYHEYQAVQVHTNLPTDREQKLVILSPEAAQDWMRVVEQL